MRRLLLRCFAPLLLLAALDLPAEAQIKTESAAGSGTNTPNASGEKTERTPVMQYMVAVLVSLLVLLIVCVPSRKA